MCRKCDALAGCALAFMGQHGSQTAKPFRGEAARAVLGWSIWMFPADVSGLKTGVDRGFMRAVRGLRIGAHFDRLLLSFAPR